MLEIDLCRVCLASGIKMYEIQHTRYPEVFEWYTDDTLDFNDALPKSLCYMCNALLNKVHSFLKNVIDTEVYLKELIRTDNALTPENVHELEQLKEKPHNLSKVWLRNSNFIALDTFKGHRPPWALRKYFVSPPIMIEYHRPYEHMKLEEIPDDEETEENGQNKQEIKAEELSCSEQEGHDKEDTTEQMEGISSEPKGKTSEQEEPETPEHIKSREQISPEEEVQKSCENQVQELCEDEKRKSPEEEVQKSHKNQVQELCEDEKRKSPEEEVQKSHENQVQELCEDEKRKSPEEEVQKSHENQTSAEHKKPKCYARHPDPTEVDHDYFVNITDDILDEEFIPFDEFNAETDPNILIQFEIDDVVTEKHSEASGLTAPVTERLETPIHTETPLLCSEKYFSPGEKSPSPSGFTTESPAHVNVQCIIEKEEDTLPEHTQIRRKEHTEQSKASPAEKVAQLLQKLKNTQRAQILENCRPALLKKAKLPTNKTNTAEQIVIKEPTSERMISTQTVIKHRVTSEPIKPKTTRNEYSGYPYHMLESKNKNVIQLPFKLIEKSINYRNKLCARKINGRPLWHVVELPKGPVQTNVSGVQTKDHKDKRQLDWNPIELEYQKVNTELLNNQAPNRLGSSDKTNQSQPNNREYNYQEQRKRTNRTQDHLINRLMIEYGCQDHTEKGYLREQGDRNHTEQNNETHSKPSLTKQQDLFVKDYQQLKNQEQCYRADQRNAQTYQTDETVDIAVKIEDMDEDTLSCDVIPSPEPDEGATGLLVEREDITPEVIELEPYSCEPYEAGRSQGRGMQQLEPKMESKLQLEPIVKIERLPKEQVTDLSNAGDGFLFNCKHCDYSSNYSFSMKRHQKVHTKVFTCKDCTFRCRKQITFEIHIRRQHTEKKCSTCKKMFPNVNALRRHRLSHGATKLYPCDLCSSVFKYKRTYSVHMRVHSGEKPFACDLCDKTFNDKSNCRKHMKKHERSGVLCVLCQKEFADKQELLLHVIEHIL